MLTYVMFLGIYPLLKKKGILPEIEQVGKLMRTISRQMAQKKIINSSI